MKLNNRKSNRINFRQTRLAAILPALFLIGCGAGGESDVNGLLANDGTGPTSDVSVRVDLPSRLTNLNAPLIVQGTVSGLTSNLTSVNNNEYQGTYQLPFNVEHTIHLSIRRSSDNLLLGTAVQKQLASNTALTVYFPEQDNNMDIDSDGDGFSNIRELEDGSDPSGRNGD